MSTSQRFKQFMLLACFCALFAPIQLISQRGGCSPLVTFSYIPDSIQTYIVPPSTSKIRIVSRGGSGGQGNDNGGYGAIVETIVPATGGQVLSIIVGGAGGDGGETGSGRLFVRRPGGGGGGSFVWEGASNLLSAAGGGGGGGRDAIIGASNAGNNAGIDLVTMLPTAPMNSGGMGGMTGGGGGNGGALGGAGGAGFLFDGASGLIAGFDISPGGGEAPVNGGAGGNGFFDFLFSVNGGRGGFGGGGGGGTQGGGGGGGYNGGGGGAITAGPLTRHGGGGGGSFVSVLDGSSAALADVRDNGYVEIQCVDTVPTMSEWGMLVLLLSFVIFGLVYLKNHSFTRVIKSSTND